MREKTPGFYEGPTRRTMVIHKNPEARIDAGLRMTQCHGFERTVTSPAITEPTEGVEKSIVDDTEE